MKWWKRLVCTIISLVWGFVSLDYLYLAFRFLTNGGNAENYTPDLQSVLLQFVGAGLFLIWLLLMAVYTRFLRKLSWKMDVVEKDNKTGEEKVRRKWFDLILQYACILSGILIRWGYLNLLYFPNRF